MTPRPARVLACLLGFLAGLLLAWAHPSELLRAPDHACGGDAHLAPGPPGPVDHQAHACAACELLASAALAPDLAGPAPTELAPLAPVPLAAPRLARGTCFPAYFSRGPPV